MHVEYKPSILTDHLAVSMSINCSTYPRGKGYWKFNNTLLQDEKYIEMVYKLVESINTDLNDCDPISKWELFKLKLTQQTKEFS